MTIVAADNFTGSASTTLQSHSPDVGTGTWTQATSSAGNAVLDGSGNVYDQFFNGPWYYLTCTMSTADYTVRVDVIDGSTTNYTLGAILRQSSSADTKYYFLYHGGAGAYLLNKTVAGVDTNLGSFTASGPTARITNTIRASGSSIIVSINGTDQISVSDSSISAKGFPGLYAIGTSSTSNVTYWEASETGGAASTQQMMMLLGVGS